MGKIKCRIAITSILALVMAASACNEYKGLQSRINEQKAIANLKNIRSAETAFHERMGRRYGTLEELAAAGLLESALIDATDYGYRFQIRVRDDAYEAVAIPLKYGKTHYEGTGTMSLYLDNSGIVRGDDKQGAEATAHDSSLIEDADKK